MREPGCSQFAAVVIGRNEGVRLAHCLDAIPEDCRTVYVDSGSVDDSVRIAKDRVDLVIQLDASKPFTAARARNEGAFAAVEAWRDLEYLQFIDGDCVIQRGWLKSAADFLSERPGVAIACGRRRERYPERSIYNQLADLEWDTPIGSATACGGDAMVRIRPFLQANGYRSDLIAGEEPEMCARMRTAGWEIWRLDAEMTLHDAAMLRFSQWWRRAARSGYAEVDIWLRSWRRGPEASEEGRQVFRSLFWGGLYPLGIAFLTLFFTWKATLALGLYLVQIVRIAVRRGSFAPKSWTYAAFVMLAKFAGFWGMLVYAWRVLWAKPATLIEYKDTPVAP